MKNNPHFQYICEKNINTSYFTTDHLNNLYVVDKNELVRFNPHCKKEKSYSQSAAYTIHTIDVTDPFKILIFNKDYNQLILLNNQLAEITNPIFLDKLGYYTVSAVCSSSKGGFWIFDQSNLQLVYFNDDLQEQRKSPRLGSFFQDDIKTSDILLREKNDYIYLGIPAVEILVFDLYGSYIKTLPVKIEDDFQVVNQNIVYCKSGRLFFYDTQRFEQKSVELPVENAMNARVENHFLYIQKNNMLLIYQWQNKNN
ncbi:MAG TPA: hypothetical protein VK982_13885 [Bacteroidales bacterium]|nr:hypothetical protein [Bacteroidales bacterium]